MAQVRRSSVQHAFRAMTYMPLAFITAKTGKNVKALLNLSQSMFKQAKQRVGTGTLNRVLREAVEAHPPAARDNRNPRIYYATQVEHRAADDRPLRQPALALRRDLPALPAERLPREAAVPRHPDQALPPRARRRPTPMPEPALGRTTSTVDPPTPAPVGTTGRGRRPSAI